MKRTILIYVLVCSVLMGNAQMKVNSESAFKAGETLSYSVRYGMFNAAYAKIQVSEADVNFQGNDVYHLHATGGTAGVLDALYAVRDNYDSYIDKNTFLPYFYQENIKENKYTRTDKATFFQSQKIVKSNDGVVKSTSNQTFDLVSAFYFARNLDLTNLQPNQKFTFSYFLEGKVSQLDIIYIGKEVIKTKLGKVRCLKFSPGVAAGRIFKKDSKMYLWVTDDQNRIPVAANVEILVGAIRLEIKSAEGLKYPINLVK